MVVGSIVVVVEYASVDVGGLALDFVVRAVVVNVAMMVVGTVVVVDGIGV